MVCLSPYTAPKVYKENHKNVEHLVLLRFISKSNESEWVAPYLAQPKAKTNQVQFLSKFRDLKKKLKHKPNPMPKLSQTSLKHEGFKYDMSLNLMIGYYYAHIIEYVRYRYTTILPWGKFWNKHLYMGVSNPPDILWEKMNDYSKVLTLYVHTQTNPQY